MTVVCPADPGARSAESLASTTSSAAPPACHSNGSVAPVALSPAAAVRAERFIRKGGFDVVHIHEPLAPIAAYGLVLTDPLPMVGTYHRAGLSQLGPAAQAVGRTRRSAHGRPRGRLRRRPRRPGSSPAAATSRSCSTASTWTATNRRPRCVTTVAARVHRAVPRTPRATQGTGRPARCLRHGGSARRVVGCQRGPGDRGTAPTPSGVRPRALARHCLSEEEKAARLAGADVLCAPSLHGESFGMVLLEGMAAGCAVVASDIEGYRMAAGGHATLVPPGDKAALSRALGVALADAVEGSGRVCARGAQGGSRSTPATGRWNPWPSATSTSTSVPSPRTAVVTNDARVVRSFKFTQRSMVTVIIHSRSCG